MQSKSCRTVRHSGALTLRFAPTSITDKSWIDPIVRAENAPNSDWCFTNIFVWVGSYRQQVAKLEDRLFVKYSYLGGDPYYSFPIGRGDLETAILALRQDAALTGLPLTLRGVNNTHREILEAAFPGQFDIAADPAAFDYVYEASSLATLAGKKLHAKRNHINRFLQYHPDWTFEPITIENLPECIAMTKEWEETHEKSADFAAELEALDLAFQNFKALQLDGGLLRVDGKVAAFTMGEQLNSDTYLVHFEKAFPTIQGAYPMINREFVRYALARYPHIQYINREDDLGIESLQKAKRSYYPVFQVEKYTAVWKD